MCLVERSDKLRVYSHFDHLCPNNHRFLISRNIFYHCLMNFSSRMIFFCCVTNKHMPVRIHCFRLISYWDRVMNNVLSLSFLRFFHLLLLFICGCRHAMLLCFVIVMHTGRPYEHLPGVSQRIATTVFVSHTRRQTHIIIRSSAWIVHRSSWRFPLTDWCLYTHFVGHLAFAYNVPNTHQ